MSGCKSLCRYSFVLAIILLLTACGSSGSSGNDDNISDGDFDVADQDYSTSCTDDQDCARGYYCDNGYCRDADCDDEHPCQDGYTCEDHICIPTGGDRDDTTCPDGYKWDSIKQECVSDEDGDDDFDLEIEEEPLPVICDPGTPDCHGNERVVCNDAGTAWEGGECEEGTICLIDTCVTQVCNAGTVGDCRDEYFVYICNNHGTGWEETLCEDHFACLQGQGCQPITCSPDTSLGCVDENTVKKCTAEGNDYYTEPCPEDTTCYEDGCQPFICTAGDWKCEGDELYYCNPLGTSWDMIADCSMADAICTDGTCIDRVCTPGTRSCKEGVANVVKECNENGSGWQDVETCSQIEECRLGECMSFCDIADLEKGYIGCEYWAADLHNSGRANGGSFALVVSNPQDFAVSVSITNSSSTLMSRTVAAGGLEVFVFGSSQLLTAPSKSYMAYHVASDAPVTVTQMNPYGNVLIFSNDASLLIPESALGTEYYGVTYPTWRREYCYCNGVIVFGACIGSWKCEGNSSVGTLTIVGTQDGTTSVSIKYSDSTSAGSGVIAASGGQTQTYQLQKYEVLNIESADNNCSDVDEETDIFCTGSDLSGTLITSDKKVAVFAGHEGTFIPYNMWAADHLEHQLYPTETWGKEFVAIRTEPRGQETDYYKIVAAEDGTIVTLSPDPVGISPFTIHAGQIKKFNTKQLFNISSTRPIMVTQFLAGQDATGYEIAGSCNSDSDCPPEYICNPGAYPTCSPEKGDPAMMLLAPNEQFRKEYIFLVPPNYKYNHVTMIAPPDTVITLDGVTTLNSNDFPSVSVDYQYLRMPLSEGAHTLSADNAIGLYVYGYSAFVSYAYTGGLDLRSINPKP